MPEPLPAGLPQAVRRHLEALDGGFPPGAVVSLAGRGAVREAVLGAAGIWLRLSFSLDLVPAREYRLEALVRLLRLAGPAMRSGFVRDRGILAFGKRTFEGQAVDRAEQTALLFWTVALAPGVLGRLAGVTWETRGEAEARLVHPFRGEVLEAVLRFDSHSGQLATFEAMRHEVRAGRPVPWTVAVGPYRPVAGRLVPSEVTAAWDGTPSLRLELDRVGGPNATSDRPTS